MAARAAAVRFVHAELREDVAEVAVRGALADEETLGELVVGQSLGERGEHLDLARAEARDAGGDRPSRSRL